MSRSIFRSHNKVGETMSFKTTESTPDTFDPVVTTTNGNVSWDLGVAAGYIGGYVAGNSVSFTYPSSAVKTITIRTNSLSTLTGINLDSDEIYGDLNFSGWDNLFKSSGVVSLTNLPTLTAVTHTYTPHVGSQYSLAGTSVEQLDLRPLGDISNATEIFGNPKLETILFSGDSGGGYNLFLHNNSLIDVDLSSFANFFTQFQIQGNSPLTGVTFNTGITSNVTTYFLANNLTNYVGSMDLRGLKVEDYFDVRETTCTEILHGFNNGTWTKYWASKCNLTHNHNLSMFPTLGANIQLHENHGLTGVTHTASTAVITNYYIYECDLRNQYDLSMFTNLGGNFRIDSNSGLTKIIHTQSPQSFTNYNASNCKITGTHNLPFGELGGDFNVSNNSGLTGLVHSASTNAFTSYKAHTCKLNSTLDLSMLTKLGGEFECYNNIGLSSITHSPTDEVFTKYWVHTCNLGGVYDVSMLNKLGGSFNVSTNPNLKNVTFPLSTETFANTSAGNDAIKMNGCAFSGNYVDFRPLSGATLDTTSTFGATVRLDDNNFTAGDINHLLDDFVKITAYNPSGWSGTTLYIGGSNSLPNTTSGGYDGQAALNTLTGGTGYRWTIIL